MDEGFEKALWDALRMETDVVDLEELEAGESEVLDPEFAAAMGAAQIAKDWRDAPKPIGCQEGDECKVLREEALSELLLNSSNENNQRIGAFKSTVQFFRISFPRWPQVPEVNRPYTVLHLTTAFKSETGFS